MSESSEDEFEENIGEHGENSGDFDGNFGELDDETVPELGQKTRPHHILRQTSSVTSSSVVLLALTKSGQKRRKSQEGHVTSVNNQLVRLTL